MSALGLLDDFGFEAAAIVLGPEGERERRGDVERILDAVGKLGVAVEKIVLTHGHIDHAGGAAALREQLAAAGAGLPDELSDKMAVVDGTMETYFISANDLVAQDGMTIKP